MKQTIQLFLYFVILLNTDFLMYSIDFKSMITGVLLLRQLPKTDSYEYSVMNNFSKPIGLEYCLDNGLIPTLLAMNRNVVEIKCNEKESVMHFKSGISGCFSRAIESGSTLQIHAACQIVSMKAKQLHSEMPAEQYPWCLQCYDPNSVGAELKTDDLLTYRTFKISENNKDKNIAFDRDFKKKNIQNQQQDL